MNRPKSYHPSGMSWREREIQKEKERKETEIRTKEDERLRTLNPTEDNFPSLGGAFQKPKPVTQPGMFAKLASEWREHDDIEKARQERENEDHARRQREYAFRPRFNRVSPQNYDRRYDYSCEEYEPHTPKYGYEEDAWNVVEYKHKRTGEDKPRYFEHPEQEDDAELNAELAELGIRDY